MCSCVFTRVLVLVLVVLVVLVLAAFTRFRCIPSAVRCRA